jgi:hypothetical protein
MSGLTGRIVASENDRKVILDDSTPRVYWLRYKSGWNRTTERPLTRSEKEAFLHEGCIPLGNYDEKKESTTVMTKVATVSKLLSMCLLVNSTEFAKAAPAKQTEILAGAGGKPIVFVESFGALRNKGTIINRLLLGEDVGMELEFNEIELTDDERNALKAVQPVIERIRGSKGAYPWLERSEDDNNEFERSIKFKDRYGDTNYVHRNGYDMSNKQAKKVWDTASKYWASGDKPAPYNGNFAGYRKMVTFDTDSVTIGCQTIARAEIEWIAEQKGWEPNLD